MIATEPRLCSDDLRTLRAAAVAGLGIAALPSHMCSEHVQRAQLLHVLPEWMAKDGAVTLLAPARRGMLSSVRGFIDFLVTEFPATVAQPLVSSLPS